jgi:hypothetical protein
VTLTSATQTYAGYPEALEAYYDAGWTDGLPVVPPTEEAVAAMLATVGLDGSEVLGGVPTRNITVTAEKVAVNAVMAGCRADYFPVVLAAVRAFLQPKANAHSTTATLAGAAHAVIVNGPVCQELGIEGGQACFGPGFRANATIGRALRLVVRNVCRTIPGDLDRASFSWPLRYSFCFAENESFSDWTPLHVQRGYQATDSVVTVASLFRLLQATEFEPESEEILTMIAANARFTGLMRDDFVGDERSVVVVIGQEHHRRFLAEGLSKEAVRDRLFELVTRPTTGRHDNLVTLTSPENLLLVAAGGPGIAQSWLLMPHLSSTPSELVVTA